MGLDEALILALSPRPRILQIPLFVESQDSDRFSILFPSSLSLTIGIIVRNRYLFPQRLKRGSVRVNFSLDIYIY